MEDRELYIDEELKVSDEERTDLSRIVSDPEQYRLPDLEMSDDQRKELSLILDKARKLRTLYRGDSRVPYSSEDYMQRFPFLDGLGDEQGLVYVTPYLDYAIKYIRGDLPSSESGYVYLIKADPIISAPDLMVGEENEAVGKKLAFMTGHIDSINIFAAIGIEGNRVTEIYRNPFFNRPKLYSDLHTRSRGDFVEGVIKLIAKEPSGLSTWYL